MEKVAILIDGGFYRRRANAIWVNSMIEKSAAAHANNLIWYCMQHCKKEKGKLLYRIFYYDCLPLSKDVFHPYLQTNKNFKNDPLYQWTLDFFDELRKKRKVALRLGTRAEEQATYTLKYDPLKKLMRNAISISDLTESDFQLNAPQKGVDMKIGIDIASLAYKQQVSQIVLIAGDSDFVPAAKLARREGIDFILDPMWANIRPELNEHIDGLHSCIPKPQAGSSPVFHDGAPKTEE